MGQIMFDANIQKLKENIMSIKKSTSGSSVKSLLITDSDWPFPETYYKSIGSTVRGFVFFS